MEKEFVHLHELVQSGELGPYSYHHVKKFIIRGIYGKKLPAKLILSPFEHENKRSRRWVIARKDIEEFKKHLLEKSKEKVAS